MEHAPVTWHTRESEGKTRTPDWYWILGIVAAALSVASILFGNILFAIVIVTGAIALGFISASTRNQFTVSLTNRGVLLDTTLYPYENIISFCVIEYEDEQPILSLRTKSIFAPQISIPIVGVDPMLVYDVLEYHVKEELHENGLFEQLVDFLGF